MKNQPRMKSCFCFLLLPAFIMSDNWVFSSFTSSVAYSCDSSKQEQLGYTCSCSYPAVECQARNLTDLTNTDIPDKTEVLDLSRNLLEHLNEASLSWQAPVRELILSHNLIRNMSSSAFSQLESLEVLLLSHNQLDHLQSGLFLPLSKLTTLDLSHNRLTQLHHDLFPTTNLVSQLDLCNNPLHNLNQNLDPCPTCPTFTTLTCPTAHYKDSTSHSWLTSPT